MIALIRVGGLLVFLVAVSTAGARAADRPDPAPRDAQVSQAGRANAPITDPSSPLYNMQPPPAEARRERPAAGPAASPIAPTGEAGTAPSLRALGDKAREVAPTILLFGLASLVPAAVLMVTAFVRINVVLTLLRQALGSPQVPGNQVVAALALLLTALVMLPTFERVHREAIAPFASKQLDAEAAWRAGSDPIKAFMGKQIERYGHTDDLWRLYKLASEAGGQAPGPEPTTYEQFPMRVIAPAFLISELTTALMIGFAIYLPFLVIDLVVASVLAAMGLVMLPPSLVSMPLKLILFVLANGWMLVSDMLVRSFA